MNCPLITGLNGSVGPIAHAEMLITHAIGQCLDKFSVSNGQQNHNQSKGWVVVEVENTLGPHDNICPRFLNT